MASRFDPALFRQACGRFATGVAICTVLAPDGSPHGLTVNSFTSVSLEPPLILICVDHRANVHSFFSAATHFAVNILTASQQPLSMRFAEKGLDRFEGIQWEAGEAGVPILPDALAQIECMIVQRLEAGDHTVLIAEVLRAAYRDGVPLLYYGSSYRSVQPLAASPAG
jgi:flavin reductase (DIM6/NTAB) family NADH-FMN oxidoreductase RutF